MDISIFSVHWTSLSDFFAMGGYGFYVWGSFLATALLLFIEGVQAKRAWHDELEHLAGKAKLESGFLKSAKNLLQREPGNLEATQKQQLSELFNHSKALKTMHEMREELGAIWGRSNSTREQLLQQLQDWCARAEASGIQALREFALRLRSYA